jgi:predicted DsbA family dithiol-disulfide isomerase
MPLPVVEFYGSMECPYAYLLTYRLRQLWPEYEGRLQLAWRALALEYVNRAPASRRTFDGEKILFAKIAPELPWHDWPRAGWDWPSTMWPAFEALACAQAQGPQAAFETSWALRHAFFARGRNIALRHELLAVAEEVTALDSARFTADWDGGRFKASVPADSRRGWHELKLDGSATLVLPGGKRITNPAIGEIDFDEDTATLRRYEPFSGDPLDALRKILDEALAGGRGEHNLS